MSVILDLGHLFISPVSVLSSLTIFILHADDSPGFSPLIICALEKCLRVLESESKTHKLYEKAMISLYTCNTVSLILQTQVDTRTLSGLICLMLTEKLNEYLTKDMAPKSNLCEWRPVTNLLCFAHGVYNQAFSNSFPITESAIKRCEDTLFPVLVKIKELLAGEHGFKPEGVAVAFLSSIICANPDDMLTNFPLLLAIAKQHFIYCLPFLSWELLLERTFLAGAIGMESELFSSGLQMIESLFSSYWGNLQLLDSNVVLESRIEELLDSKKPASSAALFLYHSPLCSLFSAIMICGSVKTNSSSKVDMLHSKTMLYLLQVKLSVCSLDDSILFLRMVLFWSYQMLSSFRSNQIVSSHRTDAYHDLELFKMCINLVKYLLDHILMISSTNGLKTFGASSVTNYIQDVIDLIFQHPIVTFSMSQPLCFSNLGNNVQDILTSSEKFHPIDCNILQLLEMIFEFVSSAGKLCDGSSELHGCSSGLVLSVPRSLLEDSVEKFKSSILMRDVEEFLCRFHMLYYLMKFLSPFEFLEIVDWMYCKLDNDTSGSTSSFVSVAISVGLHIIDSALGMIFNYSQQLRVNSEFFWLWDKKARSFDVSLLLNLYHKILRFGTDFNLQSADSCLLKIVTAAFKQGSAKLHPALFPLCMQLSRMIAVAPTKMLVYCFYPTSKLKGKILSQLIEVSPMHMDFFGKIFLGILNNDFSCLVPVERGGARLVVCGTTKKENKYALSNDDFIHLLPAALSYLMFIVHKYGKQHAEPLGIIAKIYSSMLLNDFSNWKNCLSRDIFHEEHDESPLTSLEDFYKFCRRTLLGKAITMLRYSLMISQSKVKHEELMGIFESVYSDTSFIDLHVFCHENLSSCSFKESLKVADIVAAKISFTRLLIFPPDSLMQSSVMEANGYSEGKLVRGSNIMDNAKRFMGILFDALDTIVRNIPFKFHSSGASCSADCHPVFRFLEHYILSNIVQLSMDIQSYVSESPSVPLLNQFIRSSLIHRIEDPFTLRALRCILVVLSETGLSSSEVLVQLFNNPNIVSIIARRCNYSDSSAVIPHETLLQHNPSILKSIDILLTNQTAPNNRNSSNLSPEAQPSSAEEHDIKLELVKLLRVLYHLKGQQSNLGPANVDGMNSRDLLSWLLSGYSATMSVIDLEISDLMHEIEMIEGPDCGSIADMDYLWGVSATKLKHELTSDGLVSSDMECDYELIKERRKMFFRENIPVDSKLSAITVLHFCSDRSSRTAALSLERLLQDKFVEKSEVCLLFL